MKGDWQWGHYGCGDEGVTHGLCTHTGFEMQLIEECLPESSKSIEGIFGIFGTSTKHFGQNKKKSIGPFFL